MPSGHPSAPALKQAREDAYLWTVGRAEPPFAKIRGSANKDGLNAFLQGDADKMHELLTQEFWTHQEQASYGYVMNGIWLQWILGAWRMFPELQSVAGLWLDNWAFMVETFWAEKRYDLAMPASRSFVSLQPCLDAFRVLRGDRVRRRMSLRKQLERNVPTHLAVETARDLMKRGDAPTLLSTEPRLKWPVTKITLRTNRGRIKTLAYSANRSYNDDVMVVVDERTGQPESVKRYGYKGVVHGPGKTWVRDYEGLREVHWHRGRKGGEVDYPRGHEISREVIGG
jgi:hypothetical protein